MPIRHGVHFWHDSSAKKRIVSASRRSGEYPIGKTCTAADPGPAPYSCSPSRVSGASSAAGGLKEVLGEIRGLLQAQGRQIEALTNEVAELKMKLR